MILPKPNTYDFDRGLIGDKALAYPWLIANAPGGGIAYFGEMGVSPDYMGAELETSMLAAYGSEYIPILGDIYREAQQQYWHKHIGELDLTEASPRMFLGWMVFFGDPSLRLRIADPSQYLRLAVEELKTALEQQIIPPNDIQTAQTYLTNIRKRLDRM